jgi:FO synthase subunit 1
MTLVLNLCSDCLKEIYLDKFMVAQIVTRKKVVTFSPSLALAITHSCGNNCLYCGFRGIGEDLMEEKEILNLLNQAKLKKCSEILMMSGENVNALEVIKKKIEMLGFNSYVDYVSMICSKALESGLLPHTNIGILSHSEMAILKNVNASMGLMLENSDIDFGHKVHPHKDIHKRIETITIAGKLKIPFTTGILVGLGESKKSRFESLEVISEINNKYEHIQEIIIQNYIPNGQSKLPVFPLNLEDWKELILFCRNRIPNVKIQIPPNLNPYWHDLIYVGIDDLGGISIDGDLVNPKNPWEEVSFYKGELSKIGVTLIPRLPIYREFYKKGWYSRTVKGVLEQWVKSDEFRYYLQ